MEGLICQCMTFHHETGEKMNVMPKKAISDLFPTPDDVSWSLSSGEPLRFSQGEEDKSFNGSNDYSG